MDSVHIATHCKQAVRHRAGNKIPGPWRSDHGVIVQQERLLAYLEHLKAEVTEANATTGIGVICRWGAIQRAKC
jgi:hypothetical protein